MTNNGKIVFIAEHYGLSHQLMKTAEEAAELVRAAVRMLDAVQEDVDDETAHADGVALARGALIEELADVLIMVEQLICLTDCEVAVRGMMQIKLDRQMERMRKETSEE